MLPSKDPTFVGAINRSWAVCSHFKAIIPFQSNVLATVQTLFVSTIKITATTLCLFPDSNSPERENGSLEYQRKLIGERSDDRNCQATTLKQEFSYLFKLLSRRQWLLCTNKLLFSYLSFFVASLQYFIWNSML